MVPQAAWVKSDGVRLLKEGLSPDATKLVGCNFLSQKGDISSS